MRSRRHRRDLWAEAEDVHHALVDLALDEAQPWPIRALAARASNALEDVAPARPRRTPSGDVPLPGFDVVVVGGTTVMKTPS